MSWEWGQFGDYVSVDEKRRRADALVTKLEKKGRPLSPVRLTGHSIASSFWGKAWCQNLESYGTYASRLPRGRSYVRNGAVVDLQIQRGSVTALVSGTSLYDIKIKIEPLDKAAWRKLKGECAGKVGSLIDLLRGKLSGPVMEVITRKDGGLFPKPAEIRLDCSCPDDADMCKHLAAVLYGVGTRLDQSPELLFTLRGVDHLELFSESTQSLVSLAAPGGAPTLAGSDLADVFGIELEPVVPVTEPPTRSGAKLRGQSPPPPSQPAKPELRRATSGQQGTKLGKATAQSAVPKPAAAVRRKPPIKQSTPIAAAAKARQVPKAVVPPLPRQSAKHSGKGQKGARASKQPATRTGTASKPR